MEKATDKQIAFLLKKGINASDWSKQQAHAKISEIIPPQDEKPKVEKPFFKEETIRTAVGNGAMFTSYAKDIFCVLAQRMTQENEKIEDYTNRTMKLSIELVKQAKAAFE